MERMVENMRRLYELGAPDERIEAYFQRWCRWVKGGISAYGKALLFQVLFWLVRRPSIVAVWLGLADHTLTNHQNSGSHIS
ncbi:MAG: hypothetical protein F6K14_27475 [Symploca sp. SIO2C1]|nr:hypothetical protein [Symploca sp. SIO2C1]